MEFSNKSSKVNQVVEHIMREIADQVYAVDGRLPSVNELSHRMAVSRDTVFKAYKELKRCAIIDSSPMKGYYVVDEVKRVLLLLDTYSPFKDKLYNTFVANLPSSVKVDLLFHQYNKKLFDMLVLDSIGKYNTYVVMNIDNKAMAPGLRKLPSSKLLLVDLCTFPKDGLSYIGQNFDNEFGRVLEIVKNRLAKYKKIVFVFPEESVHPEQAIVAFDAFCEEQHLKGEVLRRRFVPEDMCKEHAYICIMTDDLVQIVTAAKHCGYIFGQEVGLVVYNDMPLLDVIQDGISSFSIDFALLGKLAAEFVLKGMPVQVDMPTNFIERKSL